MHARGAVDYLVKPVEENRLVSSVKRALEIRMLRAEVLSLKSVSGGYAASARSLRRNHHAEQGNVCDLSLYRSRFAVTAAGLDYR